MPNNCSNGLPRDIKPNLLIYAKITKNDTFCTNPNKNLYNIEHDILQPRTNAVIGTLMVDGNTSKSASNHMFFSDTGVIQLKNGSITYIQSGTDTTGENGVFLKSKKPIFGRILCGTGDYVFVDGYLVTHVVDDSKRIIYVYFTNQHFK
jgi:hypothetical protein